MEEIKAGVKYVNAADLRSWTLRPPQHDRDMHGPGFIEVLCAHGVGHHNGVHGCCGCCKFCPREIWEKVTTD